LRDLYIDGDNIKMDLRKKVCENVDWNHLAQDNVYWQASVTLTVP